MSVNTRHKPFTGISRFTNHEHSSCLDVRDPPYNPVILTINRNNRHILYLETGTPGTKSGRPVSGKFRDNPISREY